MSKPYILAFDSAAEICSVALSKGSKVISNIVEYKPSMAAERLIVMVQSCLLEAGINFDQIDYLAITKGPGSFTGIRIALSSAQGFLIAKHSIKAVVLDSFSFYHHRAKEQIAVFDYNIVLLDAYRSGAYVSIEDNNSKSLISPAFFSKNDLLNLLDGFNNKKAIVSGNYLDKIYIEINKLSNFTMLPRFKNVKANTLCEIAYKLIQNNNFDNLVEPYYIALPNATLPKSKYK